MKLAFMRRFAPIHRPAQGQDSDAARGGAVMTIAARLRDLPLRTQLILLFAFLSIATTAIWTVMLTAFLTDEMRSHPLWIAVGFGANIVLCALVLAVQMSRHIARRLVQIADAANRMAAGDLSRARLDDSARDEIGALSKRYSLS